MFSRLRKVPSFGSSAHQSSYREDSKAGSVISCDRESNNKTPSVITASSRRTESTTREPSIVAPSSHLYQRPLTPPQDYTNSDNNYPQDFQFPSLAPSEFSVDVVYRRKPLPDTPDTVSTTTESAERESSPSRDSGYSDNSSNAAVLARSDVGLQSADLCRELKTVTELSLDFLGDTVEQRESSRDLLSELEYKIRPFLITLDEEMSIQETNLRGNLDRSRIADPRVTWLLTYNKFLKNFREILMEISEIYDVLEQFLRLRERGLMGVQVPGDISKKLELNLHTMTEVQREIRAERARPDSYYLENK